MSSISKPIWLCLSLLAGSHAVSAQQEKYLFIKHAPLGLFEPGVPTASLGVEYRKGQWSGQVEYGLKINESIFNWNQSLQDLNYHKIRTEVRYYFTNRSKRYVGVEYFLVPKKYTKENSYYYSDGLTYEYTTANIERNVWGLCGKVGVIGKISNSFYYDFYAGLGMRHVAVTYQASGARLSSVEQGVTEWMQPNDLKQGDVWKGHLSLGIKIGYLIRFKDANSEKN